MSKESSQFSTMLRSAQVSAMPPETKCFLWCPNCGVSKDHALVEETALDEVYACPDCGNRQVFRVR